MNKLSLDQIGFIKKRIENFIDLPASPKKPQFPENRDNAFSKISQKAKQKDAQAKSPKRVQIKQTPKKAKNEGKGNNENWLKVKQKEIEDFISQQNRNKKSVLNRYLHSQKIHLKKRQEFQPNLYKNHNPHEQDQKDPNVSKNFSFDHQLSELKRAYKGIDHVLHMYEAEQEEYKNHEGENQENLIEQQISEQQLSNLLKHIRSDRSILDKVQDIPEEKQNVLDVSIAPSATIIKPSAIKGKTFFQQNHQIQTPKLVNTQNDFNKKGSTAFKDSNGFNNKNQRYEQEGTLQKSNSEILIEKKNRVSYQLKDRDSLKRKKNLKEKNNKIGVITLSNNQSHKSLEQFFEDDNVSTIREKSASNGVTPDRKNKNYYSPSKNFFSMSRKRFPASVYTKSFKSNPYGVSNQQKFFINKYRTKELSPDERKGLKEKYELLDKRLEKILDNVKKEKEASTPSFMENSLMDQEHRQKKNVVPQGILTYQKLSPLRKFLAINKEFRDRSSKNQ